MRDLGVVAKFSITRLCEHFWSRRLQQIVVLCLLIKFIPIKRWCNLRQGVFKAFKCSLLFRGVFLGRPFAKSRKMRDLGVVAKFVITRLCADFWSRRLQQNVVLCLQRTCILIRRWCNLPWGVAKAPKVGLLFWGVSLGPLFAKSQQMRDLGVVAKFAITWVFGHFWNRRFKQNVVLCLHFTGILFRRWCYLPRAVYKALKFGLLFWEVSLGPRRLKQNVVLCLLSKCMLIKRGWNFRPGVFKAFKTLTLINDS